MLNKYKVGKSNGIAFGDSGNDLKMLKEVKHGFLLQNATQEAKSHYPKVANGSYFVGILNSLKDLKL